MSAATEVWRKLDAWIAANGHKSAPALWECYVAGPESSSDAAAWRTELAGSDRWLRIEKP